MIRSEFGKGDRNVFSSGSDGTGRSEADEGIVKLRQSSFISQFFDFNAFPSLIYTGLETLGNQEKQESIDL
jgi:hypothetical protein